MQPGAWGRRITDHIAAAIRKAEESDRDDIAAALTIILEKCEAERVAAGQGDTQAPAGSKNGNGRGRKRRRRPA